MKKLLILLLTVSIIGCSKKTTTPAPTITASTTSGMNSVECALVKKWNLKMRETYNSSALASVSYFNNSSTTYVQFASTLDTNKTGSYIVAGYKCTEGINVMVGMQSIWKACTADTIYSLGPNSNPNNLNTAFKYYVLYLSADSLIFTNKTVSTQSSYNTWYFHK